MPPSPTTPLPAKPLKKGQIDVETEVQRLHELYLADPKAFDEEKQKFEKMVNDKALKVRRLQKELNDLKRAIQQKKIIASFDKRTFKVTKALTSKCVTALTNAYGLAEKLNGILEELAAQKESAGSLSKSPVNQVAESVNRDDIEELHADMFKD